MNSSPPDLPSYRQFKAFATDGQGRRYMLLQQSDAVDTVLDNSVVQLFVAANPKAEFPLPELFERIELTLLATKACYTAKVDGLYVENQERSKVGLVTLIQCSQQK